MCIWAVFHQQPCDGSKRGQKRTFTPSIGVVGCCVCPPRPPGFLYFPNSTGEMETHTRRQIWIKGWVSGSVMVHQSKSHSLRTIKESQRIGEYMNTKSVHPGAQPGRFCWQSSSMRRHHQQEQPARCLKSAPLTCVTQVNAGRRVDKRGMQLKRSGGWFHTTHRSHAGSSSTSAEQCWPAGPREQISTAHPENKCKRHRKVPSQEVSRLSSKTKRGANPSHSSDFKHN